MAFAHVNVTEHVGGLYQGRVKPLLFDIHVIGVGVEVQVGRAGRQDRLAGVVQSVVKVRFVAVTRLERQRDPARPGVLGELLQPLDDSRALLRGGRRAGQGPERIADTPRQIGAAERLHMVEDAAQKRFGPLRIVWHMHRAGQRQRYGRRYARFGEHLFVASGVEGVRFEKRNLQKVEAGLGGFANGVVTRRRVPISEPDKCVCAVTNHGVSLGCCA